MNGKLFGATGVVLPAIGQGTWDMPERGARRSEASNAIRRGIEMGMTHLDTAEMYGAGAVEEFLGEAIRGLPRASLFITTKVLPSNASYAGTLAAADRSLKRLGCEYLDCYLLHWPGEHPLEETMRALGTLVECGKTRYAGVSNFETQAMLEAAALLGSVPLACNQVLYHLRERGIEHELLPAARERNIAVVAYTPFGRESYARHASGRAVVERIARAHDGTVHQVILAFLTRDPALFAIPKAATVRHVEENARAGELALDAGEIAAIETAYPLGPPGPLATL